MSHLAKRLLEIIMVLSSHYRCNFFVLFFALVAQFLELLYHFLLLCIGFSYKFHIIIWNSVPDLGIEYSAAGAISWVMVPVPQ